jgi:hypothetical protein
MDEEHSDEYRHDTNKQYECMDEEHSDEYRYDTTTYEERSDDTITQSDQSQAKRPPFSAKNIAL